MQKHPPSDRKHRVLEHLVRGLDLAVYALAFLGGVALAVLPMSPAVQGLAGYSGLIAGWATFLLAGGLVGFVGRLSRYWLVENVAAVSAAVGFLLYAIVLFAYALSSVFAFFTMIVALVAMGFMVRRWLELQYFGSEPGDWRHRVLEAWARRTADIVDRRSNA